jgi:2-polyprenyl-6-methoxyphenol hydroxylase-like FAD-dependent oxidoreductase
MYDAIVVGARCAGSPAAMLLARKGYRVLLVDRATFPSDTISTHVIHQPGVLRLKRWGLLDKVIASNCPPIRKITFEIAGVEISGQPPGSDGAEDAYCPRRTILDKILLDSAIAAGVEFRDRFSVKDLLQEDGVVAGVRGRSEAGEIVSERARLVVGADGRHSTVARLVHAPMYFEKPIFGCGYFSYWSGVPLDGIEFRSLANLGVGVFPTNDGLACIYASSPIGAFGEVRADIEGNYRTAVHSAERLRGRMTDATCVERVRGTAELMNFFRKPFGPGWALVGDAGYIKDPVTGQGITDAFRDAELLAGALDDAWSGRASIHEALSAYETRRNNVALPLYEFTCQLASFTPPSPMLLRLLRALRSNQTQANSFLGIVPGTTSIEEFFAPAHVRQILRESRPFGSRHASEALP